jgi:flagellar protein FlgJ
MTPQEFITAITPAAKASALLTNIPWQFTVGEAALESGWGEHAPGYNLYGIKSTPDWKGAVLRESSREVVGGKSVMELSDFRAYTDWQASIDDHAVFLTQNERYKPAFVTKTPQDFTRAVAAAGYATDPDYAQKIIEIMESHKLV